jgi:hypothetical protein
MLARRIVGFKCIRPLYLFAMATQEIPVDYGTVIERTTTPELSDVWPDDLTYAPRMVSVGHVRPYELGGKDLRALLVLEDAFARVRPKQELHVVCDDGDVYVWSRFGDDEPWTFDYRRTSDGDERDTVSRQLPGIVEAIVQQRGMLY